MINKLEKALEQFEAIKADKDDIYVSSKIINVDKTVKECEAKAYDQYQDLAKGLLTLENICEEIQQDFALDEGREQLIPEFREEQYARANNTD